jgi:hypothetical protein
MGKFPKVAVSAAIERHDTPIALMVTAWYQELKRGVKKTTT